MQNKGYCECGCGERTPIAARTRPPLRYIKGEPKPYVPGHHNHVNANRDNYVVDPETGCWNWAGVVNNWGYGVMSVRRVTTPAHRFHYERVYGPIPDGLQADHLCQNRRCCNPDHLEVVTPRENYRRGPNIRLSLEIAREIRRLNAAGRSTRSLAREYQISAGHAWGICRGHIWAD